MAQTRGTVLRKVDSFKGDSSSESGQFQGGQFFEKVDSFNGDSSSESGSLNGGQFFRMDCS